MGFVEEGWLGEGRLTRTVVPGKDTTGDGGAEGQGMATLLGQHGIKPIVFLSPRESRTH